LYIVSLGNDDTYIDTNIWIYLFIGEGNHVVVEFEGVDDGLI